PYSRGEPVYDVTFENVQAGLRTDYLFRLANQHNGFVIGTGDLSELALRWTVSTRQFDDRTCDSLTSILDTEISPELVPADEGTGAIQSTEQRIGPYELHD